MLRFTAMPRSRVQESNSVLKPLDSDKLQSVNAAKKVSSRLLERADYLKSLSHQKKEATLLFQHKVIWEQEYMHLKYLEDRIQREVYTHLTAFSQLCDESDLFLADSLQFVLEMEEDRTYFRENIVDPLWFVREDLHEWMRQHEGERPLSPESRGQHSQIQDEMKSLWSGYQEMVAELLQDQHDLELDAKEGRTIFGEDKQVKRGVPHEFHELWCPDPQLKETLIAELLKLDENYSSRMKELDKACERQACPGGWSDSECCMFQHILEQYPPDLADRRVLCFDRLKRTFPYKTLGQLMAYETWFQNHRFHRDRRNKCLEDWIRERWGWMLRAVAEVSQVQQAYEAHQLTRQESLRQRTQCDLLRQKVEQWRKEKENERLQQSELEAQRKMALRVVQQRQAAKEEYRREIARQRLRNYYEQRLHYQKESEEALQQRLEEMKQIAKERSKYDRDRVRYRSELFYQNQKERRDRLLKLREEQKARQQRLDTLRKQVRVSVERDPERLIQDTVASQARKEAINLSPLKALYEVHTFHDEQVSRDPRIRLEQQLREAGLLNSDYARHVLQKMKPLKEPRRDMMSTLFRMDEK